MNDNQKLIEYAEAKFNAAKSYITTAEANAAAGGGKAALKDVEADK